MRVCVVGTGYVGLVSGACLAARGHVVTCVDREQSKVDSILARRAPIHEEGLDDLLAAHVGRTLFATTDLAAAVKGADITLIAVGTPLTDGRIDTRQVEAAAREIGRALKDVSEFHAVVVKSTVVPGTTDKLVRRALEETSGKHVGEDIGVGMNPEFLTEGQAVEDFMHPDRIVLGSSDPRTRELLTQLYDSFEDVPVLHTNPATAEMIKYASNSLLATMISFSNEIARLCTAIGGVDAMDVMDGVHESTYLTTRLPSGQRVTAGISSFLSPGCGFGGSCLPKDVGALVAHGADHRVEMRVLQSVLDVNRGQPEELMRLVRKRMPHLEGKRATVLGLAFKPGTDDLRESPAFPVLRLLRNAGAQVGAFDPIVKSAEHPSLQGVQLFATLESAVSGADLIVLVTSWPQFRDLKDVLATQPDPPVVIDGRRFLSHAEFAAYEGIGR